MTFQEAITLANTALVKYRKKPLSDLEEAVFQGAWEGLTYQAMDKDQRFAWAEKTLKDAGADLWRQLSEALGESVKKTNFKTTLARYHLAQTQPLTPLAVFQQDWGDAIDVPIFFGRTEELVTLEQWVLHDHCRLVTIVGMGGMGKTALAIKLVKQLLAKQQTDSEKDPILSSRSPFQHVIWRSLRNAPSLTELLTAILKFLAPESVLAAAPPSIHEQILQTSELLRASRCLLILDNLDTILSADNFVGEYRSGYEDYREFLSQIGSITHQSCVILTSREKPKELFSLESAMLPVRTFQLMGLQHAEGQEILQAQGLHIRNSQTSSQILTQRYAGNPLALKIVAKTIQDLFDGNISQFLDHNLTVFEDIRSLLDQQFNRLTKLEMDIMYWLAIARSPLSLVEIQGNLMTPISKAMLLEAVTSLGRRSLIERNATCYTQQPVIMEYLTEQLIEKVWEEFTSEKLQLFISHALIQAEAKDYIRESQIRIILDPIAQRLKAAYGSQTLITHKLNQILLQLREKLASPGYGGGNLINLMQYLGINLASYDFSHLTIWQADLRQTALHHVNFAHADLAKSTFANKLAYVFSVAFNPDGTLLATGGYDGVINLWQTVTGHLSRMFRGHTSFVFSLAFTSDGRTLASGSHDYTIRLWNTLTGQCTHILNHPDNVHGIAFSPDNQLLAAGCEDRLVWIWNVHTGQCLRTLQGHTDWAWSVDFSSDGKILASSSRDGTVRLWDTRTWECIRTTPAHADAVWSVAISPDCKTIASASEDGTAKLWSLDTGDYLFTLQGHQDGIMSIAFNPDNCTLATSSLDQTVRLWATSTGQCLSILPGNASGVFSIAFSPDGSTLASGHENHVVKLWHAQTGQCKRTLQGYNNRAWSVTFSPDSQILASASFAETVKLWHVGTGQCTRLLKGHQKWIWSLAFSPDGTTIATASRDGTARIWKVQTGECVHVLEGHNTWPWSVAFSPDGYTIATGGYEGLVKLWDVRTGICHQTLQGHTAWIRSVQFHRDGHILASAGFDHTIRFWSTSTGECLMVLEGHSNYVASIAFSPNSSLLTSGSDDRTVRLWDVSTGQCLRVLQGFASTVFSVAFSPDGSTLGTGSMGSPVKLWDVDTGECLQTLNSLDAWYIAFSPDGQYVACGSQDETIDLWDVKTGKHLKALRAARLYEGLDITGATGLTEAQKATLKALGAIETSSPTQQF